MTMDYYCRLLDILHEWISKNIVSFKAQQGFFPCLNECQFKLFDNLICSSSSDAYYAPLQIEQIISTSQFNVNMACDLLSASPQSVKC